jgi:4-hydroxy-tetrahydrodipicolinate synthase
LKGLELGCSGIITATCNVTASLARKVYDDFFAKKVQTHNEKLCGVRKVFDQFDLISGLHSFFIQENKVYENILPPLSLLNLNDKNKLIEDLRRLNFNLEKSKAT